jgi:hypothetical protein
MNGFYDILASAAWFWVCIAGVFLVVQLFECVYLHSSLGQKATDGIG